MTSHLTDVDNTTARTPYRKHQLSVNTRLTKSSERSSAGSQCQPEKDQGEHPHLTPETLLEQRQRVPFPQLACRGC